MNFYSPSPISPIGSSKIQSRTSIRDRQPSLIKLHYPSFKNGNIPNSIHQDHNHQAILSAFQQSSIDEESFLTKDYNHKITNKPHVSKYISPNPKPEHPKSLTKNRQTFSQQVFKTIDRFKNEENFEIKKDQSVVNEETMEIKKAPSLTQKVCKICFEEIQTMKTGKLITPCKCAGSMKYIHEECLKTWLVSQQTYLPSATCEICHKMYKMDFRYGWKFYWRQALKEGILSLILSFFLIFMIVGVIVMIVLFLNKMNPNSTDPDSPGAPQQISNTYKLAIMISCGFINAVLFVLLLFALREAFFIKSVKKWTIFEYKKENNIKKSEKNIVNKNNNKILQMKFKSHSTNNLFFDSLFKFTTPRKQISKKIDVSANIVKVKLIKSVSCAILKNLQPKEKNLKETSSASYLFQRQKLQFLHIQKNNFMRKSPPTAKDFSGNNLNKRKTFEPINFRNNADENNNRTLTKNNILKENEEWQNIMSFKSLDEPFKIMNDGFIERMSGEFKSFDETEEKFLDVILHFKSRPNEN